MYTDEIKKLSNEQIMRIIIELTYYESWQNDPKLEKSVMKYGKVFWNRTAKSSGAFRGRYPKTIKVTFNDGSEKVYGSMQEVRDSLRVSHNTIVKHLKDGNEDTNGRRYQLLERKKVTIV